MIPVITSQLQTVTKNRNQDAQLWCTATGTPRPRVTWSRKNRRHSRRVRVTSSTDGTITSTLTISRVQTSDAGQYICTASNGAGRAQKEIKLTVQGTGQLSPFKLLGFAICRLRNCKQTLRNVLHLCYFIRNISVCQFNSSF